jgi:hypothetical protein
MANGVTRFLSFFVSIACANMVGAQHALLDPTRPPAAGPTAPANTETGTRLQSVILPKQGKPVAIIDGERVSVGGKIGDQEVMKITETEVVLKGPEGSRTLKMMPDVEKRPSAIHKPLAERPRSK